MWTMELDGTVDGVNPAWQAYTGSTDEAALGAGWLAALHPEDLASFRERFQVAAATGEAYQTECRFRRADGLYRWHLAHIALLTGPGGVRTGWLGTAIDIDHHRREREVLRASEARAREVIEHAGDIVYTLHLDGTIAAVNSAVERVLGYAPHEVLGRSIEDSLIPPDQVEIARQALRCKLAGEERSAYELEVLAKDGHRVTLEINSRLARVDGQPAAIHGIARDISSRKQDQAGLARLAAIVEDSDDAIISRLLDGTVTSWNRGAEHLYGFRADEMIGASIARLLPPELPRELDQLTARLARGERVPNLETVRLRKDGSRVDVSISLSPLIDADGQMIGISTIARDITHRKQAEARLRVLADAGRLLASDLDVEARLPALARLAVPTLADWCVVDVVDHGSDLRRVAVAHANPAKLVLAEELQLRYPPDPAASRGPHHVMRTGQPELLTEIPDEMLVTGARDAEHLRLLREVGLRSYLTVPLHARGRILGTLTFVSAESGRRYGPDDLAVAEALAEPAGLAIDNAQLYRNAQAAEARYRGVFVGVADAILVADAQRRYQEANLAATQLLGYSRDELLSMRVEDVVAAGPTWTKHEFDRYLTEGHWQGELELRRKDGVIVPVEAVATIVELPDGSIYLSALRDISERRRLEQLRRDFFAMVTHDLRTPLSTVKGSAQLLKRRAEYASSRVDAILGATAQMQRLIDDLADVLRLETGNVTLRRAPVDLAVLVNDVVRGAREAGEILRVTVVVPPTQVVGAWDQDRLRQVFVNLLDNTVKYSFAGSEVVVRIEDRGKEAHLVVIDQGPGIVPEHLPRLFDRFYRADATGAGGLGLGLYISRMLVEAHGGRIWAESEVGRGSTFTVALPKRA
jgi:PAS domain S-box-containing protein